MFGALNRLIGRQARRPDARLLALTLNNMTQGVVLFDANGRLVVCNEQYRTMYERSPDVVKPGAALIDIIRNRISSGSLSRGAEEYCEEIMSQIAAGKTLSFVNETPDALDIRCQSADTRLGLLGGHPRRHYRTPYG
jgi:PAS domain-containing protein